MGDRNSGARSLNLTKERLRVLVGKLFDYFRLNYHLGKLRIFKDTVCRFCEESDETPTSSISIARFDELKVCNIERDRLADPPPV